MIGKTVSHYKIIRELGAGGMGVVYEAVDTKLDRTVALKFLPPESTRDPNAKARFVHEAKAASALDHNNVCVIHEIDETDDGHLFLAMACYEGETLKDRIERGPLPLGEVLDITRQVAEGLTKAHERDIVHRDIKPANIFITEDGVVKILDFGLAKLAGKTLLTKTGTTLGTAGYMSPEQAGGEETDHRTDLWCLGVVLYEMITGGLPFKGDHEQAIVYAILNKDPEPVTGLRTGVPLELERLIDRCLEKNPKARYQTAGDFAADLSRIPEPGELTDRRTVNVQGISRRRNRLWMTIAAGALVMVMGAIFLPRLVSRDDSQTDGDRKMLVVLPFENLGAPEDEYFADGLTEEITSRLAALHELGVISRTSAIQYKKSRKGIKQIGEELGVAYVLEGTVRWQKTVSGRQRIRVTQQLIRVTDDVHLWAEQYDAVLEDVFSVQTDIALQVIDQLNMTLQEPERDMVEARPTENLEAYQAYLRGLDHFRRGTYSEKTRRLEIQMYERAVQLDPDFTLAWASLARAHANMVNLGFDTSADRISAARAAADRALVLSPNHPEVRLANGYVYYHAFRNFEQAREEFQAAVHGLPNNAEAVQSIGWILRRQGKFEESLEYVIRALALDPRNPSLEREKGNNLIYLGRFREAILCYDRAIVLAPDEAANYCMKVMGLWFAGADLAESRAVLEEIPSGDDSISLFFKFLHAVWEENYEAALAIVDAIPVETILMQNYFAPKDLLRGLVFDLMGDEVSKYYHLDKARKILEATLVEQKDDPRVYAALGNALAGLGEKEEAIQSGLRAVEICPRTMNALHHPDFVKSLAVTYTMVGDYDSALAQLEYLATIPGGESAISLQRDVRWRNLRGLPRFEQLVKDMESMDVGQFRP